MDRASCLLGSGTDKGEIRDQIPLRPIHRTLNLPIPTSTLLMSCWSALRVLLIQNTRSP